MSVLDRLAPAEDGALAAPQPAWRRVRDAFSGLSFEAPVEFQATGDPFETSVEGALSFPYALDVTFFASRHDACPEALTRSLALQWAIDYDLVAGAAVRRLDLPGVDEAWLVSASIRDGDLTLDYAWANVRRAGSLACLGIVGWAAEPSGADARNRILRSLSGD